MIKFGNKVVIYNNKWAKYDDVPPVPPVPPGPVLYVNMPDEYSALQSAQPTYWYDLVGMPSSSDKDIFVFKYEACFINANVYVYEAELYWNTSSDTKWCIKQAVSNRRNGIGFVTNTAGTYGTSNWVNAPGITTGERTVNNIVWKCWSNWSQNKNVELWMPVKFIFERSINKATVYLNNTLIGTCTYNDDPINITKFGLHRKNTGSTKASIKNLIIAGCNTMEQAVNL